MLFAASLGLEEKKNVEEAERWYGEAAMAKYPPAMVNYGQFLQFTKEKSEKKARKLYEQALECDEKNAQAWFSLALCLEMGYGGDVDLDKAKKAYEAAEKYGEPEGGKALKRMAGPGAGHLKKRIRGKSIPPRDSRSPKKERPSKGSVTKGEGSGLEVPSAEKKKGHRRTRSMGRG
mmetsp:Transcript_2357/g.3663  ORF Transcript_2357/g.3663 Transcript_2357/m.3663 type:complete len:176 (+) Transcript_2357:814-1341(+)